MSFVGEWNELERQLPASWSAVRLLMTIPDDAECGRAAGLLAPAGPARIRKQIRFSAGRGGVAESPERIRRLLRRVDAERIRGTLEVVDVAESEPAAEPERQTLVSQWDALLASLPPDWSHLHAELQLRSGRWSETAAIELSPLNPSAIADQPELGFRFRIARSAGYGASATMARRSVERLDERRIPGLLRVLRVVSDARSVATQGPVWRVGGNAV